MAEPLTPEDATRPSPEFVSSVAQKIAARRALTVGAPAKAPPAPVEPEVSIDGYELAAAVLAWFEPDDLHPLTDASSPGYTDDLLKQCVRSADLEGNQRWSLSSNRRIEALKVLREKGLVAAAIAANPRPQDPIQLTLDSYLTGKAKLLQDQTLAELASTHQVCGWLREAGFTSIPAVQTIVQRVDWLALLNPFEHVASDARFRGRRKELAMLRDYAGVLPPDTNLRAARRTLENIFNLNEKPPLLIVGVGGVGKSTLISRFILEHARALESHRFPFAYLDCDRAEIDASEPLTLLIEAVRQLGIEYPQAAKQCDTLRRAWTEAAASSRRTIAAQAEALQNAESANQALDIAISDFAAMVSTLGASELPVLFVLDTFEEVQWRDPASVSAVWKMLEELQGLMPRLRVVLAGRADIPDRKTQTLALTGLDAESAVAYLRNNGVSDERVAKRLAQQIGGSPLSLQLAAELYRKEGAGKDGNLAIESRTNLFFKMDSSLLQAQLYSRVLDHVHDPDVRKLAHPGLVVRRITPDLILNVLAEPCGIPLRTPADAQRLFTALKREIALVSEEPDGSLLHRRDLRMVMLELLRADGAAKVDDIHRRAVAYYESQSKTPIERAEEIYHRLALDQDLGAIGQRWMSGVELHLASAMEEFTGRRRAWLASRLGLDIDVETRNLARLEDWATIAARDAEQMLSHGQGKGALDVIRARKDRPAVGALVGLEARALIQIALPEEALDVVETGFAAAVDAGSREFALQLALQAADIVLASGSRQVRKTVERLSLIRAATNTPLEEIAILARSILLAAADSKLQKQSSSDRRKLRRAFDACSDDDLEAHPRLGYWAASVFEDEDVQRLARVIETCGIPRGFDAELRAWGANFTAFDIWVSSQNGEPSGMLAKQLGIPVLTSLTVAWGDFLLRAPEQMVSEQLAGLLRQQVDGARHAKVVLGATFVMRAALGAQTPSLAAAARPNERPRGTSPAAKKHDKLVLEKIITAIFGRFTARSFADFMRLRLDRSVDSLSLGNSFSQTIIDTVTSAEKGGWLDDLVSRLVDANPGDSEIASIAESIGVRTQSRDLERIVAHENSLMDTSALQSFVREAVPRIASVSVGKRVRANGFLVGPDLLLTADYVFAKVYSGEMSSQDVAVTFNADAGGLPDGLMRFALAEDWLVARNELIRTPEGFSGLGYAMVRVAQSPGAQPIGGPRAEAAARLRQWFELNRDGWSAVEGDRVIIIGWDVVKGSQSTKISTGPIRGTEKEGLFRFPSEINQGSAGAPCFSEEFRLIGMHVAHELHADVAVSITAINADLDRKHLGGAAEFAFA